MRSEVKIREMADKLERSRDALLANIRLEPQDGQLIRIYNNHSIRLAMLQWVLGADTMRVKKAKPGKVTAA